MPQAYAPFQHDGTSSHAAANIFPSGNGLVHVLGSNVVEGHGTESATPSSGRVLYFSSATGGWASKGTGGTEENVDAGNQLFRNRLENRTTDPASPTTGQLWLRTDL
jgi:hypothetical protein